MTNHPPPPPGSYQPPGGYPPPTQMPAPALRKEAYTSWFTRVVAWVIDYLPFVIIMGIGWALLVGTQETDCIAEVSEYDLGPYCSTGASAVGQLSIGIAFILSLVYLIWNYGYRQGTTGSSIGKSIMKFQVVGERTGQPIGFGLSIVRQVAHIIDAVICYIGYLFPLWDAKRQTVADKIMSTVCLPL